MAEEVYVRLRVFCICIYIYTYIYIYMYLFIQWSFGGGIFLIGFKWCWVVRCGFALLVCCLFLLGEGSLFGVYV